MSAVEAQSLYVMQNQFGLIKIGRSDDPRRRQRALEKATRCKLVIVHLVPGAGPREEEVLWRLRAHEIAGEWFRGTSASRKAIERVLPREGGYEWPFLYEPRLAAAWTTYLKDIQRMRSVEQKIGRDLRIIGKRGPDGMTDAVIHSMVALCETGKLYWTAAEWEAPRPKYSTNLMAALSVWPVDQRPASWAGTPFECALMGLKARHQELKLAHATAKL